MFDDNSRILELRHHIDQLGSLIDQDRYLADQNPDNFALQFAAKMNNVALLKREQEFKQLCHDVHKEFLEIKLTGQSIGVGSAPALSIAEFLEKLQRLYERITQAIIHGPRECGQIAASIKDISSLQIEAVTPGSFKLTLSGNVPNAGMFDEDRLQVSDNAFTKATNIFFDVLEADNPETTWEHIAPLGRCVVSSFKEFLNAAVEHKINIDSSWSPLSGEYRHWRRDYHALSSIITELERVSDPISETEVKTGWFINIHSEKNRFEFRISGSETIRGTFPEEIKPLLREIGVNPLENKTYHATFSKETYPNKLGGTPKILWSLLSIAK